MFQTLILTQLNGAGLQSDAHLLRQALEGMGHSVTIRTLYDNIGTTQKFDLAFHLEVPSVAWLPYATFHIWVPNMEWALAEFAPRVQVMDGVWTKTPSAIRLARLWGQSAALMGWSILRPEGGILPPEWDPMDPDPTVLHVCGVSLSKGTEAIYRAWDEDRTLPPLISLDRTGTWRKVWAREEDRPLSVRIREERIPEAELWALRRTCEVALQPSVAEGYGHVIAEGMAAGQIVVTVDGPPMSEVCPPSCGVLIRPQRSEAWRQGGKYFTDPGQIARAVKSTLALPPETLLSYSRNARVQMDRAHQMFLERLEGLLLRLSKDGRTLTEITTEA